MAKVNLLSAVYPFHVTVRKGKPTPFLDLRHEDGDVHHVSGVFEYKESLASEKQIAKFKMTIHKNGEHTDLICDIDNLVCSFSVDRGVVYVIQNRFNLPTLMYLI